MKQLQCHHLPGCSLPDRYWRWQQYAEHRDGKINIIENILPDGIPRYGDTWACTDCGETARVTETKKPKGKARQGAML